MANPNLFYRLSPFLRHIFPPASVKLLAVNLPIHFLNQTQLSVKVSEGVSGERGVFKAVGVARGFYRRRRRMTPPLQSGPEINEEPRLQVKTNF